MAKHIYLKPSERTELEQLIKSGSHAARTIARARVLLLVDRQEGVARRLMDVAEAVMVSYTTVHHVKRRYFEGGLENVLQDKKRPGRLPLKMTGEVEAQLIALTCSQAPEGYERWTLRLLADRLVEMKIVESISHVSVGATLKQ